MPVSDYHIQPVALNIEGIAIQLWQVTNVDELLEALLAKGDTHTDVQDERIPYWAELWPAAVGLSRYLVLSGAIQAGMQVLEIGCGLGLPGIVAGRLGAQVTLTDYLPEALDFACRNWKLNNVEPARYQLMDWRNPLPELAADLVLAADIAYEQRFFEHLPAAFRALCRPGGRVLVSDPGRPIATDFFANLPQQGFQMKQHSYAVTMHHSRLPVEVHIYELSPV
ncbi:MAG TPA: 50S ribosomal protein L11 methyltransferase [Saprospiraceae bacterium]|nr:50S ribosomal protein L11 methyltransferase [Saprospiraceae bacterium]HMP24862.1 50S ribosomal protein L11 methyltransferase [Saprospiraceae bacterium]